MKIVFIFKEKDCATAFNYEKLGLKNKIKLVTIGTVQKIKRYYEIIDAIQYLKKNVMQYAKGVDILVCASGGSGYSMAAIESMVTQKPIVAWDSPVYRQLLKDDYSGKLVKS